MKRMNLVAASFAAASTLLVFSAWRGSTQQGGMPQTTSLILGQSFPNLTDAEQQAFDDGLKSFSKTETRAEGLGVVFNGTSCGECHRAGAIGGAGTDLTVSRVRRIGGIQNNVYTDLAGLGGPVLQARSMKEFNVACPVNPEIVPPQAQYLSHRITTPLFGLGLVEAIPAAAILSRVGRPDPDGVMGTANMVYNPETLQTEVGRFGWKAQHSSLHLFAGDAYVNEMGVTSASFPNQTLPQGQPVPPGWDEIRDPGADQDVTDFAAFIRFLAPADRRLPITPLVQNGDSIFQSLRCSACHVPVMMTGPNPSAALNNQPVRLYSDLLLHHMGSGLADGIQQGQAMGDQFRTAPLWGLSRRQYLMHDGRAQNAEQAILFHGGEATAAKNRYARLSAAQRQALLAFLGSL